MCTPEVELSREKISLSFERAANNTPGCKARAPELPSLDAVDLWQVGRENLLPVCMQRVSAIETRMCCGEDQKAETPGNVCQV